MPEFLKVASKLRGGNVNDSKAGVQMKNVTEEFLVTASGARKYVIFLVGVVLGSVLVMTSGTMLRGQVPTAESASAGEEETAESRYAWRLVPKAPPPAPTDPKLLETLNKRAREFDRLKPERALDEPQPTDEGHGRSFCIGPDREEIPFFKNEAVVVATFKDYQVYLTPSHRSIYTNILLSVEQVLEAGPSQVPPGEDIELLIPGGTVILSNGSTLSDDIDYDVDRYCLQPGHRYVLFLEYFADGRSFWDREDWELVNGVAEPNDVYLSYLASRGESKYSGLPEATFIDTLRTAILRHKQ
jgi:hypothetical protein